MHARTHARTHAHTHTHTQLFCSFMDFVWDNPGYQRKHSPTHSYRGYQSSLVCFIHLIWSMASFLFNLCAWQSFSTISLQVFFGLPLALAPATSYCIHFFTQSLSSFRNTCPYPRSLFCCTISKENLERDCGKGCKARGLNRVDAMDRSRWRDDWWPRWVWVGECFFWYRLTQVVPDKIHRAVKWLCVCVS